MQMDIFRMISPGWQQPGEGRRQPDVFPSQSAEETEDLLREVPRAYHTEINDVLLTALGMAIQGWTGI